VRRIREKDVNHSTEKAGCKGIIPFFISLIFTVISSIIFITIFTSSLTIIAVVRVVVLGVVGVIIFGRNCI